MPVAVGVIREVEDTHVYDRKVAEQDRRNPGHQPDRCMDDRSRGRDVGDRINAQSPMKNGGGGRRMSAAPFFCEQFRPAARLLSKRKNPQTRPKERKNRKLRFNTRAVTCLLPATRSTTDVPLPPLKNIPARPLPARSPETISEADLITAPILAINQ